jgi:hypothetical protein
LQTTSAGVLAITGTTSASLGALQLSATGAGDAGITGALAITGTAGLSFGSLLASGQGALFISGSGTISLGAVLLTAEGTVVTITGDEPGYAQVAISHKGSIELAILPRAGAVMSVTTRGRADLELEILEV